MSARKRFAISLVLATTALAFTTGDIARLRAEDPAGQFLDALREREFFDTALNYLDSAETSPVVPPAFKAQVPYERGLTLVQIAIRERNRDEQISVLKRAEGFLNTFLEKNSASPLVPAAKTELANILIAQARLLALDAKGTDAAKLKQADELYARAHASFQQIREDLKARLSSIKPNLDPENRADRLVIETRDQYRKTYLQVRLLSAAIIEEQADVVKSDKAEYEKRLNVAIQENLDISNDYRNILAGVAAKVFQSRCYVKLGKFPEAIGVLKDVLEMQDEPALREVKLRALVVATDCWNQESVKQYAETIKYVGAALETARPSEERTTEFVRLKLGLARALKAQAESSANPQSTDARRDLRRAKALTFQASSVPGDLQKEARDLLAALGGPDAEDGEAVPVTNFAEAAQAGKDSLNILTASEPLLNDALARSANATGAEKAELTQKAEELQKTVAKAREDAIGYYRQALKFAGPDDDGSELALVYHFLSYLYYSEGEYLSAAVIGEHVARRFASEPVAPTCGKFALASYSKLQQSTENPAEQEYYGARLRDVASYVADAYRGKPEAATALTALIPLELRAGNVQNAVALLERIPADSPERAKNDLIVGKVAWAEYLRGAAEVRKMETDAAPAAEIAAKKTTLEALKQSAETTLKNGIGRMQASGKFDENLAMAGIFLAQIYVDSGRAGDAVTALEDPAVGPLPKLAEDHAAFSKASVASDAYRVALRAYVSSIAAGADADAAVAKAKQAMTGLEKTVGTDAEGQNNLVAIYVSVARDLQTQLDNAPPAQRAALSKAFAAFLEQVGAGAQQLNVLIWVAETFYGIAESSKGAAGEVTPATKEYLALAKAAYERIVTMGRQKGAGWVTPEVESKVDMKLAMIDRQNGEYKSAVDRFEKLLMKNGGLLNVQIEAAETLQAWGAEDPQQYYAAIKGARQNPETKRNVIWGWTQISNVALRNQKFEEYFFLARLRMAECLRDYAMTQKDAAKKKTNLQTAEKAITQTAATKPTMGGPVYRKQFDDLLKQLQKDLGKPADGLSKIAPPPAPATAAK